MPGSQAGRPTGQLTDALRGGGGTAEALPSPRHARATGRRGRGSSPAIRWTASPSPVRACDDSTRRNLRCSPHRTGGWVDTLSENLRAPRILFTTRNCSKHASTPSFSRCRVSSGRVRTALAQRVLSNRLRSAMKTLIRSSATACCNGTGLTRPCGLRGCAAPAPGASESPHLLALTRLSQPDNVRAAELLWHVASGTWPSRFPDIDLIALHELTALLAAHPETDITGLGIPPELLSPVETGLRVVLTWDADNTDIDLWVIDPAGEPVYYGQARSQAAAASARMSQGYGPEVFTITRPCRHLWVCRAHSVTADNRCGPSRCNWSSDGFSRSRTPGHRRLERQKRRGGPLPVAPWAPPSAV